MRDFVIRTGDTASPLVVVPRDDAGNPVEMGGADVVFAMAPAAGGELVVEQPAEVVNGAGDEPDRLRYDWQSGETDDAGLYLAEFRVTYADDEVQTFPNEGAIVVAITADVGAFTVGDLLELDPTLTADRAATVLKLARRAVVAYCDADVFEELDAWPDRVELVVLRHALRIAGAKVDTAGQVVSESLGSYTYRLARPLALADALELGSDLQRELAPWATGRAKVYDIAVGADTRRGWPVDWWQRNADHEDGPAVPLP